jgi:hypothetical protein
LGREVSLAFAQSERSDRSYCVRSHPLPRPTLQPDLCALHSATLHHRARPQRILARRTRTRAKQHRGLKDSCGRCRKSRSSRGPSAPDTHSRTIPIGRTPTRSLGNRRRTDAPGRSAGWRDAAARYQPLELQFKKKKPLELFPVHPLYNCIISIMPLKRR